MKHAKRVAVSLATAASVVAALLYLPAAVVVPAMIALAALVHLEFSVMASRKYAILKFAGVAAGVAYMAHRAYCGHMAGQLPVMAAIFFLLAVRVLFDRGGKPLEKLAVTALGFVYIPFMLSYFVLLPKTHGMTALLYVVATVKFSDMGGFAVGMLLGRHKMCPSVSPNKTWEGLFGSVLAGCIMSAAFMPLTGRGVAESLALGTSAALLGTLGDLVESMAKRDCGVKDSASFMPAGLGGLLDMFDSLIFAPALLLPFLHFS